MATFAPQTMNERVGSGGYTHRFDLTYRDITQATVSTGQVFNVVLPLRAGDKVLHVALWVPEPFQDTTDANQNTNTVTVGDSGDTDLFIVAIEANKNGTLGTFPARDTGDALPYTVPATPLEIQVVLNPTSGKILNHLNKGRLFVEFDILALDVAQSLPAFGGETG
jgi:hypothetical protein